VKRLLFLVPVVVFVVLAGFFYAGLQGPPPSVLPSPLIGKPAPDFTLPPLDGQAQGFTRAELATGHPTIVNFWASWCAPCRIEHPVLEALAAKKGIALYGVDYKDTPKDARALLTELGDPFGKIVTDREGRAAIDWGVTGVPETFVVDGKGIIRVHYAGPLSDEILERLILPAMAK
jgi:cytochrome c biogenesis protein CcmG/thiol:disulfide interchange protein DsbE